MTDVIKDAVMKELGHLKRQNSRVSWIVHNIKTALAKELERLFPAIDVTFDVWQTFKRRLGLNNISDKNKEVKQHGNNK